MPQLVSTIKGSVFVLNPLDALGKPVSEKKIESLNKRLRKQVQQIFLNKV